MDAPTLDDTKNYMISHTHLDPRMSSGVVVLDIVPRVNLLAASIHSKVALLDSATTHTILIDPLFFSFTGNNTKASQVCQMQTIVGRRDFKFREDRATIVLSGSAPLLIDRAMCVISVHQARRLYVLYDPAN